MFSNSFSLGIFTSLFSIVTAFIGMVFAKGMKTENYSRNIKISTTFTILSLFLMITNCNSFTVILFNFLQTISKELTELIKCNNEFNLANIDILKKEYKVEYFVGMEFSLWIGRTISQILFIFMAFFEDTTIMITLFSMFLILYELSCIDFNDEIYPPKEKQISQAKRIFLVRKREEEYE